DCSQTQIGGGSHESFTSCAAGKRGHSGGRRRCFLHCLVRLPTHGVGIGSDGGIARIQSECLQRRQGEIPPVRGRGILFQLRSLSGSRGRLFGSLRHFCGKSRVRAGLVRVVRQ